MKKAGDEDSRAGDSCGRVQATSCLRLRDGFSGRSLVTPIGGHCLTSMEGAELLWSCCVTPNASPDSAATLGESPVSRKRKLPADGSKTGSEPQCAGEALRRHHSYPSYPAAVDTLLAFSCGPPTPSSTSAAGVLLHLAPAPSASQPKGEQGDAAVALLSLAPAVVECA